MQKTRDIAMKKWLFIEMNFLQIHGEYVER